MGKPGINDTIFPVSVGNPVPTVSNPFELPDVDETYNWLLKIEIAL